jgi:hypothetical protein
MFWRDFPNLPWLATGIALTSIGSGTFLTKFDGVDFNGDLTQLVFDQLATGMYRGREDSAPGDWLDRAWHALPAAEQPLLTAAIHRALAHPNPEVRSEAVRLLDGNPSMANPEYLLDLVERQWDLFKGLRGPLDPPGIDRGHAMAQLAAHLATGPRGVHFRQTMARDLVYGMDVLAALAENETAWAVEHIHELVAPELDPSGTRLNVLVVNLQRRPALLRRAVANLVARQPNIQARLAQVISESVNSARLRAQLLRQLT